MRPAEKGDFYRQGVSAAGIGPAQSAETGPCPHTGGQDSHRSSHAVLYRREHDDRQGTAKGICRSRDNLRRASGQQYAQELLKKFDIRGAADWSGRKGR